MIDLQHIWMLKEEFTAKQYYGVLLKKRLFKSNWDLRASGDLDYPGWDVQRLFMGFFPQLFLFLFYLSGERCNAILLRSSRIVSVDKKTSPDFHRHGPESGLCDMTQISYSDIRHVIAWQRYINMVYHIFCKFQSFQFKLYKMTTWNYMFLIRLCKSYLFIFGYFLFFPFLKLKS